MKAKATELYVKMTNYDTLVFTFYDVMQQKSLVKSQTSSGPKPPNLRCWSTYQTSLYSIKRKLSHRL